jgi:hypothetical protein
MNPFDVIEIQRGEPGPYVLGRGRVLYVDVDDTLITPFRHARPPGADMGRCIEIGGFSFEVLERNLDTVRRFAANADTTIIVWSNGGATWAEQVVKALNLEPLVAACLSKPTWAIDDRADFGFAGNPDVWIEASR